MFWKNLVYIIILVKFFRVSGFQNEVMKHQRPY